MERSHLVNAHAGPSRIYTYDRANQPTRIRGADTGDFVYDGNYKRVKQVINGETIYNFIAVAPSLKILGYRQGQICAISSRNFAQRNIRDQDFTKTGRTTWGPGLRFAPPGMTPENKQNLSNTCPPQRILLTLLSR